MKGNPFNPPTISPGVPPLGNVIGLLESIEVLDADATGRVCLDPHGAILVQSRRICWVAAANMRRRLTETLRKQRNPPLTREQIERVVTSCAADGTPIGQALVAGGLVSERGLRVALYRHSAEALIHLALAGASQTSFVAHASAPYDPRFAFTTVEIFAEIGARRDYIYAAAARARLSAHELGSQEAFAFIRPADSGRPVIIAVHNCDSLRVRELQEAASAAASSLDIADALGDDERPAIAATPEGKGLVAWRRDETYYAAVSDDDSMRESLANRVDDVAALSARAP